MNDKLNIIYGAGEGARRLMLDLRKADISIDYLCQSVKTVNEVDGISVLSREEMLSIEQPKVVYVAMLDRNTCASVRYELLSLHDPSIFAVFDCASFVADNLVMNCSDGERELHLGTDYPDKTFYVIRRKASNNGLFSYFTTCLGSVVEASLRGFIPVIDMQNTANPMLSSEKIGRENAWEYYFCQPSGYSLNDIRHASNVILSSTAIPTQLPGYLMVHRMEAEFDFWHSITRQFIRLQPDVEIIVEKEYRKIANVQKMLGVLCRGTDYVLAKPHGHSIQPDIEAVIRKCMELKEELGYQKIYLATEDETIWKRFQIAFPDQVVSYQKHHFNIKPGEWINDVANRGKVSPKERSMEYLISIAILSTILSRCPFLLAGICNGSIGALLLSNGFSYQYFFDLGLYE